MTAAELETLFVNNNVPTNYYSFGGMGGGDCYVLERKDKWVVYYSERGGKYDVTSFDTEDEACREVLKKVNVMIQGSQHRSIPI